MNTSTQNRVPETLSPSEHRNISFLEWLGIATLFFPIACLLFYVATSPCTLAGQWHDFLRTVPLLPLPSDVSRLSARQDDGTPILGLGQASADLYGELFITRIEPTTLIAFYQARYRP